MLAILIAPELVRSTTVPLRAVPVTSAEVGYIGNKIVEIGESVNYGRLPLPSWLVPADQKANVKVDSKEKTSKVDEEKADEAVIRLEAKDLKIRNYHNMGIEKLKAKIAEAKEEKE